MMMTKITSAFLSFLFLSTNVGVSFAQDAANATDVAAGDDSFFLDVLAACAGPIASFALCDVSAIASCTDCYGTVLNETMEAGVEINDCASGTTFACDTIDSCTPACGGAACSEELKAIMTCITNEASNGLIESSGCDIYNCAANDTTTDGGDATTDGGDATTDGGDATTGGNATTDGGDATTDGGDATTDGGDATTDGGDATTDGGDSGSTTGGSSTTGSSAPFNAITFSKFFGSALLAVLAGLL